MSSAHTFPMPAMGNDFPGAHDAPDIGAGIRPTPAQRPPASPQYVGHGGDPGWRARFRLPQTQSELITFLLWVAGPFLIAWGLLPALTAWQLWQADFVRILIGAAVFVAQWENHKYLTGIPAKPKAILLGMAMLAAVGLTSPEMFAPVGDSISGAVEQAINNPPAEPSPASGPANPAQPQK